MTAYYTVMGAFALVGLVIAAFAVMPGIDQENQKDIGYVREDQKRGILEPETIYEMKEKDHA